MFSKKGLAFERSCPSFVIVQVAVDPKALVVYSRLHAGCELVVQDSSCLCAENEEASFLTLQLRAQSVGQVCNSIT